MGGVLYRYFLDGSKSYFHTWYSNEILLVVRIGCWDFHPINFNIISCLLCPWESSMTSSVFAVLWKGVFSELKIRMSKIIETLQKRSLWHDITVWKVWRRFRHFWRRSDVIIFLTSRRNFDDVITPSFLSVTVRNFAKCLVLIKQAFCEIFMKIEVVEHVKLELRPKQEKTRHFSVLWRHNSVIIDGNFVKVSDMIDITNVSVHAKYQVHIKFLSSYFTWSNSFQNPAGQWGGGCCTADRGTLLTDLNENFLKFF